MVELVNMGSWTICLGQVGVVELEFSEKVVGCRRLYVG
jgi:hypothetical protein